MRKFIAVITMLFILKLSAQSEVTNVVIDNDTIEVSTRLVNSFSAFQKWADVHDYDYKKRLSDIKGIYYVEPISDPNNLGETYLFKDKKDFVIINSNIKMSEVLNVTMFHEMYHLFGMLGDEAHCLDKTCTAIMVPSLSGYLYYSICNWQRELRKYFEELKRNGKTEAKTDVTECKILHTGED